MSNMDSMDREQKKRQLRQRMISSPGGQSQGGVRRQWWMGVRLERR